MPSAEVAHSAGHGRATDLQLIDELGRAEPGPVSREQRDEHERRHPGHAGIDECAGESLYETTNGRLIAAT